MSAVFDISSVSISCLHLLNIEDITYPEYFKPIWWPDLNYDKIKNRKPAEFENDGILDQKEPLEFTLYPYLSLLSPKGKAYAKVLELVSGIASPEPMVLNS